MILWRQSSTLERWSRALIAVLTGGTLVLVWSIFSLQLDSVREAFLGDHSKKLSETARSIASVLDSSLAEVDMALGILCEQAIAHPGTNYTASAEFLSLVKIVRNQSWAKIDLRAVDKQGHLRLFNGDGTRSGFDLSSRDYFKAQVPYSGPHPFIGRPVKSTYNGQWSITISQGLPPESGDLALLAVAIDFPILDKLISVRADTEGQNVTLFRGDGTILYRYPLPHVFPANPAPLDWFSIQAAGTDAGIIEGSVPKVFQRTGLPGLVVVVSRPSEVLDRLWADEVRKELGWVLLLSLVVVVAGAGLWSIESRLHHQRRTQEKLARIDPLTGLLNRRAFDEACTVERQRVDRIPGSLGLALLDLDHFKQINDRYGHPLGDRILKEFSLALVGALRATDVVARVGGEEFAILLPGTVEDRAVEIAERVRLQVAQVVLPQGHLSTSIGLSIWDGSETYETWYTRTDQALYRAKVQGRDRVVLAEPRPS